MKDCCMTVDTQNALLGEGAQQGFQLSQLCLGASGRPQGLICPAPTVGSAPK
jgi:hypothetical protein